MQRKKPAYRKACELDPRAMVMTKTDIRKFARIMLVEGVGMSEEEALNLIEQYLMK